MGGHVATGVAGPGEYEPILEGEGLTKNVKKGYKAPLPGGRGAVVSGVTERKDQVRADHHRP